jgi:ankyrin repeat protein
MKTAATLGLFFVLTMTTVETQRGANSESLGAQLVAAVKEGEVVKTSALLREWKATGRPWPNGPDDKPLLFFAIEGREKTHPEIVELLLENGASVKTRGPLGMTALHWAAAHGYVERTTQILNHHPALEATDDRGRTPLLVAQSEAAEKLIAAHANILAMDKDGVNALHYAAQESGQHLDILFKAGFKVVDARSNAGLTPLHIAAVEGTESAVRWLLDHGANVNAVTAADYDYLPRHLAPGYGYEIRIPRGATPLRLAADQHEKNKWSSSRYKPVIHLLKARDATGSRNSMDGL